MSTENTPRSPSLRERITIVLNTLYDSRVEIVTAILLSFTALVSAWSAYQANEWGSQQSAMVLQGNIAGTQATRLLNQSLQQTNIDVMMFLQYSQAYSTDNTVLADFIYQRFRPEMKVAVDAWLETTPLQNPDAPSSPFQMEAYTSATAAEAATYNQTAGDYFVLASEASARSTNYVLLMVIFATVLFFGGVATKFRSRTARRIFLSLAIVMFIVGVVTLLNYPVKL